MRDLFDQPFGIAVGPDDNVYVSDATFNTIRRITPDGVVTTVAGRSREHGLVDGVGTDARFAVPYGIAIDAAGTIFVVDHGNHAIRPVTTRVYHPGVHAFQPLLNGRAFEPLPFTLKT